jgi:hypothetical protein
MTTVDLITALFYEVDEQLRTIPKHPEAHLWPSGSRTCCLRILFRDFPHAACMTPISRWSALETSFQAPVHDSWPASEHTTPINSTILTSAVS